MMVIMILAITALLARDAIAEFEASQRPDRAAREALVWFRFARNLAMTTGKNAKVAVDTAAGTLSVYWQSNGSTYDATPYPCSMTSSGTAVLTLSSARELSGTSLTVTPGTTTYFEYGPLGTCNQTGTLTLTYAGRGKTLTVTSVGDPQIQ